MRGHSAGLLLFRRKENGVEVFLVHPGGPFWEKKNEGAWTIPKGGYLPGETPLDAAIREFQEETGFSIEGEFLPLGSVRQSAGKTVTAWAIEGDCNPADLVSNTCQIEWPPRSGRNLEIPEVDRGAWFSFDDAARYILKGQRELLERLQSLL